MGRLYIGDCPLTNAPSQGANLVCGGGETFPPILLFVCGFPGDVDSISHMFPSPLPLLVARSTIWKSIGCILP